MDALSFFVDVLVDVVVDFLPHCSSQSLESSERLMISPWHRFGFSMGVRGVVGPCKPGFWRKPKAVVVGVASEGDAGWKGTIAEGGNGARMGYFVHVAGDEDVAPGRSLVAS